MTSGGKLNYVHYTGKTKARGIMSLIKRGHDQGEREKGNEGRLLPGPQCPQPCQRCVWPHSVGLRSQDCISWAADSRHSCGRCFIHAPSRWSSIRRSTEWPEALPPPVQPSLSPLLFNSNTVVEDLPPRLELCKYMADILFYPPNNPIAWHCYPPDGHSGR